MGAGGSQPSIFEGRAKRAVPKKVAGVALETGFVCSVRPGWKSSQADIASKVFGAVPQPTNFQPSPQLEVQPQTTTQTQSKSKPEVINKQRISRTEMEGGGSVTTLTGSKSNTVQVVPIQDEVMMLKNMSDECHDGMKDVNVKHVRSVDDNQAVSSPVIRCPNTTFVNTGGNSNHTGGSEGALKTPSFGRKFIKRGRGETEIKGISSKNYHTSESDRICTPVKRKLLLENKIGKLISTFENSTTSDPPGGGASESPAKRLKIRVDGESCLPGQD